MPHVNAELLALMALGEPVEEDSDLEHLAACAECAAELAEYQRAATIGRSTLDAPELLEPHPRVWDRITEELGAAPVVPIRRRPRRIAWISAAAAAALVVVGLGVWQAVRPAAPEQLAAASLESFPAWPGATGSAVVEREGDGSRVIRVDVDVPGDADGYREVWLITSDGSELISLGIVQGSTATFAIPDGIDLGQYDLVDVSAEPLDGDPAHSGDSIVRGQLS